MPYQDKSWSAEELPIPFISLSLRDFSKSTRRQRRARQARGIFETVAVAVAVVLVAVVAVAVSVAVGAVVVVLGSILLFVSSFY
jgi:Flp pilus assembly protein TadB